MTLRALALSAASPAMMSSCIFRPSRQAGFAACKKARRSSSTSPRGRKASRQKTSDLSNPRDRIESPGARTRDRAFSLGVARRTHQENSDHALFYLPQWNRDFGVAVTPREPPTGTANSRANSSGVCSRQALEMIGWDSHSFDEPLR